MEFSWPMLSSFTGVLVVVATGMSVVQGWKDEALLAKIELQYEHNLTRTADIVKYTVQTEMGKYENIFTLVEVQNSISDGLNSGFQNFKVYFDGKFKDIEKYVDEAAAMKQKKIYEYLYIDTFTGKRYRLKAFPLDNTVFIDTVPILSDTIDPNPQ